MAHGQWQDSAASSTKVVANSLCIMLTWHVPQSPSSDSSKIIWEIQHGHKWLDHFGSPPQLGANKKRGLQRGL